MADEGRLGYSERRECSIRTSKRWDDNRESGARIRAPGGTFRFGDAVRVSLSDYCLDEHEVTVEQYVECIAAGVCSAPQVPTDTPRTDIACNYQVPSREEHPVNCVTWQQADTYCLYRGKQLPSEAQWEYAARGGARNLDYPWGNAFPTEAVACWDSEHNRKSTCSVGQYAATSFGLRDMAGNVDEWVGAWYAPYPSSPAKDLVGTARGTERISRGGAWLVADPTLLRGIARIPRPPEHHGDSVGIRCAIAFGGS